jgi:hypothetical protein
MSTWPAIRSCSAGPGASVGNVRDEGLRLQLEQLTGQVVRGAVAGRAVVQLARVLADELHQVLEVGGLHPPRVDDDDLRHAGDQAHGDEVGLDVVVELGVHAGRDGVVHRAHEEAVAVGRGLGRQAGTQRATGAAFVVDDELAAQVLGHHGKQRPREGVGAAARREGHDHVDGFARPGALRVDPGCGERSGAGNERVAASGVRHLDVSVCCLQDLQPGVPMARERATSPWRNLAWLASTLVRS